MNSHDFSRTLAALTISGLLRLPSVSSDCQDSRLLPPRVESRRSAVACRTGGAEGVRGLSFPHSPSGPSLRFFSPLIEPDVRISRIRLSDGFHDKADANA